MVWFCFTMTCLRKSFLFGAPFLVSALHAAINITGYDPLVNDRFANDPSFIISSSDPAVLSGVAIADTGLNGFVGDDGGRWVTMVSRNVFITAEHFSPPNGSSVTFYQSNDPLGGQVTRSIQSSQRIGTSDLRIGVLDTPLPIGYNSYNFVTEDITSLADFNNPAVNPYRFDVAALFGRSPTAYTDLSQEMSVGLNRLDGWVDSITAAGSTDAGLLAGVDDSGDALFVSSEALLQLGDSGAPVMVIVGGELTIVGINWFIATGGEQDINGFSYVGNYDTEIQNYIDANPVPELSCFALLAGLYAGAGPFVRRRRRI
ncbi:MAG: hypothetical protein ACPGKS_06825 [Coraliomargarita sp.]